VKRSVELTTAARSADDISTALTALDSFAGPALTARIAGLERNLTTMTRAEVETVLASEGISEVALDAALLVKRLTGQIHVVVHVLGILNALPDILEEGEQIISLSLGAGNTGRRHDLETTHQIAEFKFIAWRGGPESIRQNGLFIDLFNLASTETSKRRVLYVVGKEIPLRFLANQRAISSVLSKNAAIAQRFAELHGDDFRTVRDYYEAVRGRVEIVDLASIVPGLAVADV